MLINLENETNFEEKLIDLIKQFDFYKKSNKLRVGIVGYPNTGKNTILSSITKHKLMNASKDIPNVDEVIYNNFSANLIQGPLFTMFLELFLPRMTVLQ